MFKRRVSDRFVGGAGRYSMIAFTVERAGAAADSLRSKWSQFVWMRLVIAFDPRVVVRAAGEIHERALMWS